MTKIQKQNNSIFITNFNDFAHLVDYSFVSSLKADPESKEDGIDHKSRQVYSGHFVPVVPTPLENPEYVLHSKTFFKELCLSDDLVYDHSFVKVFSADLSETVSPMKKIGWATGYALSIYGNEYISQCPFQTGNGYGDGRAISIFEGILNGQRWEMQLKGGGPTPYCRGADGRAVLRSSVREFLAQEFMYALGIPTSRSLTLFVSKTDKVQRPWYSYGTHSKNPDILVDNPIAISTRVAHSFLRVGQLELFSRRVRNQSHPNAYEELMMIVKHVVQREYKNEIDQGLPFEKQIIELAKLFRGRLTRLIAQWIRVGYCQGNFNSDNCSVGGHTLDYGPFGFCESFDPDFQPWTGGGQHFSFFNQPNSAQANFHMFLTALRPLLSKYPRELSELDQIFDEFAPEMKSELEKVWALKLGLITFIPEIFNSLMDLMIKTHLDFTIFFRELSHLPESIHPLKKSFYQESSKDLDQAWQSWLSNWREQVKSQNNLDFQEISTKMKQINPKYTWREWTVVPAYQSAMKGDYSLLRELQEVLSRPYEEQSIEIESKYYQLKPNAFFNVGGISHYSCSS